MNERCLYLCHHGVIGMHWGIRRYQPYGHGGYDPEHTEGKYVGKQTKAGVSTGSIGGAAKAKFGLAKNTIKNKTASVKNRVSEKVHSFDKEKAKKVAKALAITAAVGAGVAIAANTNTGKRAVNDLLITAKYAGKKLNTIDTGYVKEIHSALNTEYQTLRKDAGEYSEMRAKLVDDLRKKYTKVKSTKLVEEVEGNFFGEKKKVESTLNTWNDWTEEISADDRKALDALSRIIDKKEAQAIKAGQRVADYSEKHLSAYNTKRTEALKLKALEAKQKLDGVVEKMKKPADEAEAYRKQLQDEGLRKLQIQMEKKVEEALAKDIQEDLEFIKKYLKAA